MKVSQGYFLIEISIVLAITLLIFSISIPSLNFLNQQFVSSDLEKLNLAFHYMQQSAIASNKNLSLKFDNYKTYSYDNNHKELLSNNVEFGIIKGIKGPPSFATKPISQPISFVNNQVTFYNDGKIQPGTAYLIDQKRNYQYALTTPISQVSFIRKYKFENNKWKIIDN